MTQVDEGSAESVTEVLGDDTPTARALWELRRKIYQSKVGPGAVTDIANELGFDRGRVNKAVTPSNIRMVASIERHLGGDSA
jgi:hypothetical protein